MPANETAQRLDSGAGVVTLRSPWPYAETVERLSAALETHGIKVFAKIDQQAEAAGAGLQMPPMTLILFGNPRAGTPLMIAQPQSGLDLPLKLLVSEAKPGEVTLHLNSANYVIRRHGLDEQFIANLAGAEKLVAAVLQG